MSINYNGRCLSIMHYIHVYLYTKCPYSILTIIENITILIYYRQSINIKLYKINNIN